MAQAPTTTASEPTTTAPAVTLTFEQLKELLAQNGTGGGFTPDAIAKAFAATQKQENASAPMVSMFNPRGERDHPRPVFVAKKVYQNGVELDPDILMVEEIEGLNALKPGSYQVEKANGKRTPFTVNDVRGFDGETIERREIAFPSKDENQMDHRGLFDYCLDVLTQNGQADDVTRIQASHRELNALRRAR